MTSAQSPETQAKILLWRQKCLDNTITEEEMVEAAKVLRGDRMAAAQATKASKTKAAKAAVPSAADLLAELGMEDEGETE